MLTLFNLWMGETLSLKITRAGLHKKGVCRKNNISRRNLGAKGGASHSKGRTPVCDKKTPSKRVLQKKKDWEIPREETLKLGI